MRLFNPNTPITLAEGTRVRFKGKLGTVYRNATWGCELVWDESIDPDTGEVLPLKAGRMEIADIARAMAKRALSIVDLPANFEFIPSENPAATAPRPAELGRAAWRECYVAAAQKLIDSQQLEPKRADFVRKLKEITDLGFAEDGRRAREKSGSRRGGKEVQIRNPPNCGETIFGWWRASRKSGPQAHFDRYRNSGNRSSFLTAEEEAFIADILAMRLTEERPSIQSVVESVQSFFRVENKNRKASGTDVELTIPGYGSVWCTRTQAESIFRGGVIKSIVDGDAGVGIAKLAFAREEVAKFLATLERLPVQAASASLVDIVSATKRTGRSTGEILGAILTGDIPACRVAGPVGVNTVRFRAPDLDPVRLRPPRVLQESA